MRTAVVAFVLSLITGSVLTPLARRAAKHLGAIDHALSSRKIHAHPIPRLGGVAIVGAFYVPILGLLVADSSVGYLFYSSHGKAVALLLGGALIAALGIYDDIKGAGARLKFAVQFGVGALVYLLGYRIDSLANPFGEAIQLGWLGLPFTLLWIAGVINAINLIDGLDGLAGGVALISVLTTCTAALYHGEPLMVLFTATLAGGILAFLRHNFNPASIFMGDTGSMFLGFVLATSSIQTHHKSSTAVAIVVPIIALGLPIADTLLAIVRRGARGAPLFHADREHIHHKLLERGFSQRQAVLVLYGVSVALALVALFFATASGTAAAFILAGLALVGGLVLRYLGYLRVERAAELLEERRRNLELRKNVRLAGVRLRRAAEVVEVWDLIRETTPTLGADCVSLRFVERPPAGVGQPRQFAEGFDRVDVPFFRTKHSLLVERPDAACIELGWRDRKAIDRDTELAVEQLCRYVQGALERVSNLDTAAPTVKRAARTR